MSEIAIGQDIQCYHCGEDCRQEVIVTGEKHFCCEGCKMVFQLLNKQGLCDYYSLNKQPGINKKPGTRKDKFAFLDDSSIQKELVSFANESETHITFYLPQIHCSSCLYLLENLHKLEPGIVSSRVNFARKEVDIVFHNRRIGLRHVAELLAHIGYEPYISLNDLNHRRPGVNKGLIYRLGVAGFCFANSMLFSFPEYLGLEATEKNLQAVFRLLNLLIALPVFFYSAWPFFYSGYKGLRSKFLNIDAPIALAILVTFIRSVYEVGTGTGGGYFDSMTGIVFFMLLGRVLQDKTYQQLSFDRDFTSYFPLAATALKEGVQMPTRLPDIKIGDTLLIHNEELVPADGILVRGKALIDYSFVTGESALVPKETGEIVYAGGRQTGGNIELLVVKEVAQSYLTRLWSKEEFQHEAAEKSKSFVHQVSKYFTWIVLSVAITAAISWSVCDPGKILDAVTAVLIVACPCALLLSNTFTNGNVLRILSGNGLYLRSAQTIEDIAGAGHIVFDKTGTLTSAHLQEITYSGISLTARQQQAIGALAAQSQHPLSRMIANYIGKNTRIPVEGFGEIPGQGIAGFVDDELISIGSKQFVTGEKERSGGHQEVFVAIDNKTFGSYVFRNNYRDEVPALLRKLSEKFRLSVISGDNAAEGKRLAQLLGKNADVLFHQSPEDKLDYIRQLQQQGEKLIMIGDGLNDAGALKQSNAGIAITEDSNNFTPASDAILEAKQLSKLDRFIQLCKTNKRIVVASFVLSILYNMVGLYFAVQGALSPLVAAILMPASSLSILLISFGGSNLAAKWYKL
jgi:P-type Cu+ transporter